jgi:hypothetical protein
MAFALVEMKIVLAEVLSRVELRAAPGHRVRVVRRSATLGGDACGGGTPGGVGTVADGHERRGARCRSRCPHISPITLSRLYNALQLERREKPR